ncbi:MAG: hypothetical protein P4N59_18905 [Negativicutes bacterium]|nr:hypothetical protein [Negativicutes bacterium]
MANTTMPLDNEAIANLPGDIRMVTNLITSHTDPNDPHAVSVAHAANVISYGSGTVQTALKSVEADLQTAADHEADKNNPHGVTPGQINAVAQDDAVATITPNAVIRRDASGKIAGDITGNAATATLATNVINGIPSGGIIMWAGASSNIPSGWHICDGSNGTPNLYDRFIIGAGHNYAPGAVGGEATHVLTIPEMPVHHHMAYQPTPYSSWYNGSGPSEGQGDQVQDPTSDTGGGAAHNNMPPYYALCYIMKV